LFISVIIPCHELNDKLMMCMESINNQDYIDYEVIIASDNSSEIIEYVLKNYPHYKSCNTLFEGMGVAMARNKGANLAKGDLLVFIDSDCISPNNLLSEYSKNFQKGCLLIGGINYFDDSGEHLLNGEQRRVFQIEGYNKNPNKWWWEHDSWGADYTLDFYTANVGVCKESYEVVGGFDESLKGIEDIYFAVEHYELYEKIKFIDVYVKHCNGSDWRDNENHYNWQIFKNKITKNYPHYLTNDKFLLFIQLLETGELINLQHSEKTDSII
jgi:glycosyltransferase involved in cell wall biosynthesis